ncbi:MAG: tRNA (mnm(5)s(2)U34)-methyltransferase [Clostridium sp.]
MFNYVSDISKLAQHIIEYYLKDKDVAIDGTLGNGHDTDFLKDNFKRVYSFEIQEEPCEAYEALGYNNVKVVNDSHHLFKEYVDGEVNCIMYNLGFLPKGDKNITTLKETSLKSIEVGLSILASGGIMTVCIYRGHSAGKEEESCIIEYLKTLDKKKYGVMCHDFINRDNNPPVLVVVEKK